MDRDPLEPVHPAAVILVRYRNLIRMAWRGACLYAILLGVATFWGGDERFQGHSYEHAERLADYAGSSPSVLWGLTVLLAGLLALAPHRKAALCGMYGVTAWSVLFAASFLLSVNTHPLAGVSGVFAHGFIAVVMTGLVVVRRVDPRV